MKNLALKYFFLLSLILVSLVGFSQKPEYKPPLTRILFIFDASFSMHGKWENGKKMEIAKNIFNEILDSLQHVDNLEIGLRIYGHQSSVTEKDCDDTRLEVPFSSNNIAKIKSRMRWLQPKGNTPIARSLKLGGNDFPKCDNCRNIIILITDGKEECDEDPCAVSLALQEKGIILEPFVIGIGLDVEIIDAFECMGNVYDAKNEEDFKNIFNVIISQALNATTAQINLLDIERRPNETNIPYTLYNTTSKKPLYNYVHTMNHKGNPDTIKLDHLVVYDLKAHTIPPVRKDSIVVTPGIHNVIGIDAPQGYLNLQVNGSNEYKDLKCLVKRASTNEILHVQDFDTKEKYLVGKYDLQILSLPRIEVKNIDIKQSHTTKVEIEQPGLVTIEIPSTGGYGTIFQATKSFDFVCKLQEANNFQTIVLQPGKYKVVFRSKNAKETLYTIEKQFTVVSGTSIRVKLN